MAVEAVGSDEGVDPGAIHKSFADEVERLPGGLGQSLAESFAEAGPIFGGDVFDGVEAVFQPKALRAAGVEEEVVAGWERGWTGHEVSDSNRDKGHVEIRAAEGEDIWNLVAGLVKATKVLEKGGTVGVLTTVGSGNFTFQGSVESTPTVSPLFPGAVNLVSLGNPSATSKSIQALGLGQNMAPGSDTVEFFSTNGSLSSAGVYLWAGTDGFIDAVTEAPAANNVQGSQVLNVTVVSPTSWKSEAPYTP